MELRLSDGRLSPERLWLGLVLFGYGFSLLVFSVYEAWIPGPSFASALGVYWLFRPFLVVWLWLPLSVLILIAAWSVAPVVSISREATNLRIVTAAASFVGAAVVLFLSIEILVAPLELGRLLPLDDIEDLWVLVHVWSSAQRLALCAILAHTAYCLWPRAPRRRSAGDRSREPGRTATTLSG